jgi:hypothetical protein
MTPLAAREPCRACGKPHRRRIGTDGLPTYRHPDGHAHEPTTTQPTTTQPTTITTKGYTSEMFGTLAECATCGAAVINRHTSMDLHTAFHQEHQ